MACTALRVTKSPPRQGVVQCCDRFRQVMGLGRSDDGCGDDGALQNPGQRNLSHARTLGFGDPLDRVDDGLVER